LVSHWQHIHHQKITKTIIWSHKYKWEAPKIERPVKGPMTMHMKKETKKLARRRISQA